MSAPRLTWILLAGHLVALWVAETHSPPLVLVDDAWIRDYIAENISGRES
jgi:hypothetical protein